MLQVLGFLLITRIGKSQVAKERTQPFVPVTFKGCGGKVDALGHPRWLVS